MTYKEIKEVFESTPKDETVFVMFDLSKVARNQVYLYNSPVECRWDNLKWYFQSRWQNSTSSYPVNFENVMRVITKKENPEYFL